MRPQYLNKSKKVAVGDPGACTVNGGQPGIIKALRVSNGHWEASILWPNGTTENADASQLYWVEPSTVVEIEILDRDIELLLTVPATSMPEVELKKFVGMIQESLGWHS